AFGPDRLTPLITGHGRGVLRLDVAGGRGFQELPWIPADSTALGITSDGATVITGDGSGTLRFWDAGSRRELEPAVTHGVWGYGHGVDPDGEFLVTAGGDERTARVWRSSHRLSRPAGRPPGNRPASLHFLKAAYSPDRATVVTGSDSGLAQLWES